MSYIVVFGVGILVGLVLAHLHVPSAEVGLRIADKIKSLKKKD